MDDRVETILSLRKYMIGVALKRLGNLEAAEDVVQISMVKAIAAVDSFRGDASLKAWFRKIVINACYNAMRSRREFVDVYTLDLSAPEIEIDRFIDRRELLKKEIALLPPKQKKAVVMRIYEGTSFAEIANAMGAPYNTAKANYRHGILAVAGRIRNAQ